MMTAAAYIAAVSTATAIVSAVVPSGIMVISLVCRVMMAAWLPSPRPIGK